MQNNTTIKQSPWNMFESYREGQVIYGRDKEISTITESIVENLQTILYGKSGIGKTSLLQAGIFPKLREKRFFSVIVRLAFYGDEPLRDVVKRLIEQEAENENAAIGKPKLEKHSQLEIGQENIPLWNYFSRVWFTDSENNPYIPVLVFDQFEETINNEDNWQKTVDFLRNDIYDLLDDSLTDDNSPVEYSNYRLVFSMREDYLYCLEDIIDRYAMWELRYNRFRILALDDKMATEVITRTCGENGLESGKEGVIIKSIIRLAKANSGSRFSEINTAMLSLICSLLYDNASNHVIKLEDVRKVNSYLYSYYYDIARSVGTTTIRYLEKVLLTKDGRRSSVDEQEAIDSGKITKEQLNKLEEIRFIKRVKTDVSSSRLELVHDYFAKIIYKKRKDDLVWYASGKKNITGISDRFLFVRALVIRFMVTFAMSVAFITCHSVIIHGTWEFWNHLDCITTYISAIFMSVYLIPIFINRLHDVNKTGWWGLILPISLVLVGVALLFYQNTMMITVTTVCSCFIVLYLMYLLFQRSSPQKYEPRFSNLIQITAWHRNTNVLSYIKVLAYELLIWLFIVIIVSIINRSPSHDILRVFIGEDVCVHFGQFLKQDICLPAIISLLPIYFIASTAIPARAKTMGIPYWLSYIPYINIITALICFFPESLLQKLGLLSTNKEKQGDDDGLLAEVDQELYVSAAEIQEKKLSSTERILSYLIPFYPTIKMVGRSLFLSHHQQYFTIAFIKSLLCVVLFFYLSIENESFLFLGFAIVSESFLFVLIILNNKNIYKELMLESQRGDLDSIYYVGKYYFKKKHYSDAISYYEQAAEKGHAYAQLRLAKCYENGIGVLLNKDEAKKWYRRAAASDFEYSKRTILGSERFKNPARMAKKALKNYYDIK